VALSSSSEENPGFGLIDQITAACGFTYLLGGTSFGACKGTLPLCVFW
jgi:hypothetical protein